MYVSRFIDYKEHNLLALFCVHLYLIIEMIQYNLKQQKDFAFCGIEICSWLLSYKCM
jgi:hypothetical protein